jgi:hypothetical protein
MNERPIIMCVHAPRGTVKGVARRRVLCGFLVTLLASAPDLKAEAGPVKILSEVDPTGTEYTYKVTNAYTEPIVYIEFPHFKADMFRTPPGWEQECTYLANVGVKEKPGVCIGRPGQGSMGVLPGHSEAFGLSTTADRPPIGRGTVIVRFADGKEVKVAGVQLPEAPPGGITRHVPLIGVAAIFFGWVLFRTLRGRRKQQQPQAAREGAD